MEALIEKGNHPRRENVGQSNNPEKNDIHLLLKGFLEQVIGLCCRLSEACLIHLRFGVFPRI